MGWRGVLRSAAAASRAAERQKNRRDNAAARGHARVDRIIERLDREVERDLERVAAIEARIVAKPLTASGVVYDTLADAWTFKALGDDTGQLKWNLTIRLGSDAIAEYEAITDGTRRYQLVALSATRWAVYAAFRVSVQGGAKKATKLFNKSNPIANRVLLVVNGQTYRAIEGQLDVEVAESSPAVALVAFPLPPPAAAEVVSIDFLFKTGLARIGLPGCKPEVFTEAAKQPSLVDAVREQFAEHTAPVYEQANQVREELTKSTASSRGWVIGLIVVAVAVFVIVFG